MLVGPGIAIIRNSSLAAHRDVEIRFTQRFISSANTELKCSPASLKWIAATLDRPPKQQQHTVARTAQALERTIATTNRHDRTAESSSFVRPVCNNRFPQAAASQSLFAEAAGEE
ncbi:uncharacterized protein LOC108607132 [Drosophila busckii]|uniref:uncharacterized protein LOC108607132 n=1 Tax=Drosophila busckii TaxID=30019 RepID=UPI00083F1A88|nr:uncharacterized protein LOC108607132 [Drosophila busckii]